MKILIYCRPFYPAIGGIETLVEILASEFSRAGHEVKLATHTPSDAGHPFAFEIVRRPSAAQLLRLVRWCDVFFHPQQSLKGAWPLLLVRKPWIVSHNTWYARPDGRVAWQDRLKQRFNFGAAANISVSRAIAEHVSAPSTVIHNTYRDDVFRVIEDIPRERELVFVGRLVSDKGADLLVDALARLRQSGLRPGVTIVGAGPERAALEEQARSLGVADQITFTGSRSGHELARTLNAHHIMVVPSRWQEPFGIVALEGVACGCAIVASAGGGLPDAIGPCGVTFKRNDAAALAAQLAALLRDPRKVSSLQANAASHLARHDKARIAGEYLHVFESARAKRERAAPRMSV